MEEQGAATQEISRNVQQAAPRHHAGTSNITDVKQGASETGSASSQVLSAAQVLSGDSNLLRTEVESSSQRSALHSAGSREAFLLPTWRELRLTGGSVIEVTIVMHVHILSDSVVKLSRLRGLLGDACDVTTELLNSTKLAANGMMP